MLSSLFWLGGLLLLSGVALVWYRSRRGKHEEAVAHPLPRLGWSSLQVRLSWAYVWTNTLFLGLLLLIALWATFQSTFLASSPDRLGLVTKTAREAAVEISTQASGRPLHPYERYQFPSQGTPITISMTGQHAGAPSLFALLVAPDGHLFASSAPFLYPNGALFSRVLADRVVAMQNAMAGMAISQSSGDGKVLYALEPVWSNEHRVVGVVYVQAAREAVPDPSVVSSPWTLLSILLSIPLMVLTTLLLFAPMGGVFGWLTSRKIARRLRVLAGATISLASGDYHQRVPVQRKDEVGILEEQFNRMAQRLAESRQREQELLAQNVRMAERARISRELHDAIAQNLFSLSLLTEGIQSALPVDSPLLATVSLLDTTAERMTREMRALLLELRPIRLEEVGLKEALEELAAAYTTRLHLSIATEIATGPLSADIEHALLRITQEALSNAVRHAQATKITITLTFSSRHVILRVQDDGVGLPAQPQEIHHGLGLRLMEERARELGGTMEWHSLPGQGTQLSIVLPAVFACDGNAGGV